MNNTISERARNWGITILRVVVAIVFIAHGSQKWFEWGIDGVTSTFSQMGLPLPRLSAYAVATAEFGGGILLLLGLFTRFAAVPLAITMLVAALTAHRGGFFLPAGMEFVLTLGAASAALVLTGAGALALDNVLARRTHDERRLVAVPAVA